jgi:small-conductance mechanosensitive channel
LARRLYRTYATEGSENIFAGDLRNAFDNDDAADAAFTMFDKDMNGDISMEELEAVCVEIGRERKAITASLKDLDSVVSKLDNVFSFIVLIVTILVFISLISSSASTALTSLGSTVLALSWLFTATAQEFLQSLIFVFVKHPFDVGDRVTIYGNTGTLGKGDDYFVKEISLLFTEFKKMEGHVVQAPNSYLNTLFILNQRRSGGLAEAIPVTVKFGTTLEQIDGLRRRLLEFVTAEDREYQKNILTELTTIYEAYSVTLNVVFFYKSNWQNELLRLQRRNKFICAMMVSMQELDIEGPRLGPRPGTHDYPMYVNNNNPPPYNASPESDHRSPGPGLSADTLSREGPIVAPPAGQPPPNRHPSILRHRGFSMSRQRGESISEMGKRVDFSLGMQGISSGANMGDIYDQPKPRLPSIITTAPSPSPRRTSRETGPPSEDDGSLAGTVSRDSQFGSLRAHKNRFFGRTRSKVGTGEEGTDLDELEAGTRNIGFGSMPGIPEVSGFNSPETESNLRGMEENRDDEMNRAPRGGRTAQIAGADTTLDPRTGIVSSQAVQSDGDAERGELPVSEVPSAATGAISKKSSMDAAAQQNSPERM